MSALRYDAPVDPAATNTSHAIVLELVGHSRRVLDVGCATGRLGEILVERGCEVVGIEFDAEAADLARERLSDVVVGDLDDLDLGARFGATFDTVVLADVLEHLRDPRRLLRSAVDVLRPGGAVVVSLPNVAHGAVRLALLQGRFDYSDVGLLDSTHLRFFTRTTVDELLAEAGLAPVDVRRTRAGIFETEIDLDRETIDPHLLDQVRQDPEATTYQFVVKAVRDDADHAVATLAARNEEQSRTIARLESELATRARTAPGDGWPAGAPQVGLWGLFDVDEPAGALRAAVYQHELGRRLPGTALRLFAPLGVLRQALPLPLPLEPLRASSPERRAELATALDGAVVVGPISARLDRLAANYGPVAAAGEHPAALLGGALAGVPTLYSAVSAEIDGARTDDRELVRAMAASALVTATDEALVEGLRLLGVGAAVVPDPLLLVPRLDGAALEARRATLGTARGHLDRLPYVLVHGDTGAMAHVELVAGALQRLHEAHPEHALVVVNFGGIDGEGAFSAAVKAAVPPVVTLSRPVDAADAVAAIAGAELVVSTAAWARSVATGFGVPSVAPDGPLGSFADRGVLLRLLGGPAPTAAPAVAALDRHLDELAEAVASFPTGARTPVNRTVDDRLSAYSRARQDDSDAWRVIVGELLGRTAALEDELARARALTGGRAAEDERRRAAADELDALLRTRTFRASRRARAAYGRLRRVLR